MTVDCVEPHGLAQFYRATFGYEVENHEPGIRQLLADGLLDDADVIEVDGHLAFADTAACRDPTGLMPRLHLQRVPEARVTKNRLHLDFQYGNDADRDDAVRRVLAAGGSRTGEGTQGPAHVWVIVADPEGNEHCVAN